RRSRAWPLAMDGEAGESNVPRETFSLTDAETPEKRVEHILNPCPPGDPVKRDACLPQMLGDQQQIALLRTVEDFPPRLVDSFAMTHIEGDRIGGRQQLAQT